MKNNLLIVSFFVLIAVVAASVFVLVGTPLSPAPSGIGGGNREAAPPSSGLEAEAGDEGTRSRKQAESVLPDLEAELENVLKTSARISPERHSEIERVLSSAEKQNYSQEKIIYLRSILSKLAIGGAGPPEEDALAGEQGTVPQEEEGDDVLIWHYTFPNWSPSREPPECPDPLVLEPPVDVDLATSVLYPGQVRGGNYKSHGGFRFDKSGNDIEVRAPLDGFLWRANRYLQEGEVQYQLDITNPCGIMYTLDHLRELPPKWMRTLSKLPEPSEDSLPTSIDPPLPVARGEILATAVGLKGNVFMDLGVYDLRQQGNVTQDRYAVCWFYLLPSPAREKVLSLPGADYDSGKESDYC